MSASPARTVAEVVAHVHRGLVAVRTTEAVLFGIGALLTTVASALLSGGRLANGQAWVAGSVCAVLVAVSFLRAHRTNARETASVLDGELGFAGALVTAYEVGRPGSRNHLEGLLEARVSGRLSVRRALRAALPLSALPILAPFAGAALLGLARDATTETPVDPALAELSLALERGLARTGEQSLETLESGRADELGPDAVDVPTELGELARAAAKLEDPALDVLEEGGVERELARIQRRLEELSRVVSPGTEVERGLHEAQTLVDAARMRLGTSEDGETFAQGGGGPMDTVPGDVNNGAPALQPTLRAAATAHPGEFDPVVSAWVARRKARREHP